MGHGSGGKMTEDLIRQVFQKNFSNPFLDAGNDFASVQMPGPGGHLSISTDAHIVSPIFFPGGDIGKLAICGTVNDMSMSGAIPLYLTASFILEEGLDIDILEQVVISMQESANEAGVLVIAGDTKVVEKGKGDGIFISTTGIGWIPDEKVIGGEKAQPGDVVIISGTIGDHGIAVLTARGEFSLESSVRSDVAPLNHMIAEILKVAPDTHVLRDPTRGGLATTLNEIARQSKVGIIIHEESIPITNAVQSTCELLGFDPLYVANEGKLIVIAPDVRKNEILEIIRNTKYGNHAAIIGEVVDRNSEKVILKTQIGTSRILDVMAGEMLPRIC
ncbi:MAG: hydrogenase expression/formation protein HypE [Anaerolineaceae bacterium]